MSGEAFTPRLLEGATYASTQRKGLFDVGFLISIMVMLLAFIPSALAIPALSELGHPATLMALLLFGAWVMSRTHPRLVTRGPQPMRWIMGFFFTALLASYAAGLIRGMPPLEDNAAIRAVIGTFAFLGIILCMADGVQTRERLDGIIRVMLLGGTVMALIGLVQAYLAFDVTVYIQIPGLSYHGNLNGLEARSGQNRVASTTGHYIEFGTVMAMMLPFAVHMGRFAPTRPMRQWAAIAGGLMFLAVPMTMSRTGIVALGVAMLVMIPAWSWRVRFNLLVPTIGLIIVVVFTLPGLLGSLIGLFQGWDEDPSVQGRAEDWELVQPWLAGNWWFGRGQGTFIPTIYTWLDNQWLQQLLGGGIVGVFSLVLLHFGAIVMAAIVYRKSANLADRHLAACLISTQMIAIAVGFTFDSLGFRTYAYILCILTGAAATLWRLSQRDPSAESQTG